jgi:hypothetical protein
MVETYSPQVAILLMRTACCIPKATDTNSQHVILIVFPRQERLRQRASVSCIAYIAYLAAYNAILCYI